MFRLQSLPYSEIKMEGDVAQTLLSFVFPEKADSVGVSKVYQVGNEFEHNDSSIIPNGLLHPVGCSLLSIMRALSIPCW